MEKKQTAVEWFNEWVIENPYATHIQWAENLSIAIEIEKANIKQAFNEGMYFAHDFFDEKTPYSDRAENYYNIIFKQTNQ